MLKNVQAIMDRDVTHAAEWLWYEELSGAEASAIHARVQSDPNYREDLDGLLSILAAMEGLAGERAVEAIASDYRHLLRDRRMKRRVALGIAAGILVALGAALAVFSPWPGDRALPTYFTRVGEQQTIQLDDGSVITLNTGGHLVVDYRGPERRVLLERGEAYFEVADDPERFFAVDLGTHAVTVLGTAFNVRRDTEGYQVAVTEGEVALHEATADPFRSPGASWGSGARIKAGWVAELDTAGKQLTAFQPESMEPYVGWRKGILSFAREPLYQVIQELNRYSRRKILIEDPSIQELSVFLTISIHDIDTGLRGLQQVLPIKVTRHYDRIVITAATETDDPTRMR